MLRTLEDLINQDDPGIDMVRSWAEGSAQHVEFLPRNLARSEAALVATQVTTRSPMGAVIHETGGLFVDHGWVRVLGGGGERLPGIDEWNRLEAGVAPSRLPDALVVGWDVLGGFFALNGGAFEGPVGEVFYFAQDALEWESLERGYSDWLGFLFSGDMSTFYGDWRWPGWDAEIAELPGESGIHVYPPLCAEGPALKDRSRRPVPLAELWGVFVRDDG